MPHMSTAIEVGSSTDALVLRYVPEADLTQSTLLILNGQYHFNVLPSVNSIVLALIVTGRHYLAHVETSVPCELGFTNTTIALHIDRGFTNSLLISSRSVLAERSGSCGQRTNEFRGAFFLSMPAFATA